MQEILDPYLPQWRVPSAKAGGIAVVSQGAGIQNLRTTTLPALPPPGPHEIIIDVLSVCLNHRDIFGINGTRKGGWIPCSDAVGRVVAIGSKVKRVELNDRVCPIFSQNYLLDSDRKDAFSLGNTRGIPGTLCKKLLLSEENVVHVPDHLSDEEASTLPCAGVTAWRALVTEGRFKKGETVLVEGTGGVSAFGAQFANALGGKVICTSSSDSKLKRVKQLLSVKHTINYNKNPDWGNVAKSQFGGADHVLEIGGAGTFKQALVALNNHGSLAVIGILDGIETSLNLVQFFSKQIRMNGIAVGSRKDFEDMNKCIAEHRIRPLVSAVFPMSQACEAFKLMEGGGFIGQIVVSMNKPVSKL